MQKYPTVANAVPSSSTALVLLYEVPMVALSLLIGTPTVGSTVKSRAGTRSTAIGMNGQAAQAAATGSAAIGPENLQTVSK